jgi:ribulose-5-phosphate 4-epimerase/fuculose-1-phosphate aldolase
VACKHDGLRSDNFYSANLHGLVAHHDFEGVTTSADEQPRLLASLGDCEVLVLRSHGLLTLGPHVPGAFARMWSTQRACEVQMAADSMQGPNRVVPEAVLTAIPTQMKAMTQAAGGTRRGELAFVALLRRAGVTYTALA